MFHESRLLPSDVIDGMHHIAENYKPLLRTEMQTEMDSLDKYPNVVLRPVLPLPMISRFGIRLQIPQITSYPLNDESRAKGNDLGYGVCAFGRNGLHRRWAVLLVPNEDQHVSRTQRRNLTLMIPIAARISITSVSCVKS